MPSCLITFPFVCFVVFFPLYLYFLCSRIHFSLSPCWCLLSEAPTIGWRDESLMASDFNIGVVSLSVCFLEFYVVSILASTCMCIHMDSTGCKQLTVIYLYYLIGKCPNAKSGNRVVFSLLSIFVCISFFLLVDVSCLKLPPSGGVMNRWWLLIDKYLIRAKKCTNRYISLLFLELNRDECEGLL